MHTLLLFNAWNFPLVEFLSVVTVYLDNFAPSDDRKAVTMPYRSLPGKNESTFGCGTRLIADSTGKRTRHFKGEAIRPHAGHAAL